MTVIAGAVGAISAELRQWTLELLQHQARYASSSPRLRAVPGATFGISAFGASCSPHEAGNLLVAADMRLDNRSDLARRLALPPDTSDQALLATAWQKAGDDCLDWLVGDFALAVFDHVSHRLFLARDPGGHRPLHYATTDGGVLLASMPAALGSTRGTLRPNMLLLAKLAAQLHNATDGWYFEGVSRVRPGEVVRIEAGGRIRQRIFWNPSLEPKLSARSDELVEEFRHLLDSAVACRIAHRSRPIASHLSSGFDSSSVTATAARLLKAPDALVAFTSAPRFNAPIPGVVGRFADESVIAAQTAAMHGIRHVVVRETPSVTEIIRRFGALLQAPVVGAVNMAWWAQIRQEASALGASCLLTAEMGNQSLDLGGLPFLAEWVRRGAWGVLCRQVIGAARGRDTRLRGALFSAFGPWLPESVSSGLRRAFLKTPNFRRDSFLRPEWQAAAEADQPDLGRAGNPYADELNIIRLEECGTFRKSAIAGDGIEEMDPMSDRRLFEFGLRLPPQYLLWNGVSRPLMRAALSDRLPQAIFDSVGRGMQGADWGARIKRDEAWSLYEEMSSSAGSADLFDLRRMREALERWPTADWNQPAILQKFGTGLIPSLAIGMFIASLEGSSKAKPDSFSTRPG